MTKFTCVCGLVALTVATAVTAEEFPLKFKTIPAKDVMSFPGGSGAFVRLRLFKPAELQREPKAVSQHPLYGVSGQRESGGFLVRVDESKGDGKGYDTVLIDLNQNGDLTDDEAGPRVGAAPEGRSPSLFGPFQLAADKAVAGGRPAYFAQLQIYNTQLLKNPDVLSNTNMTFGYARLKPGWYLEAVVSLGSVRRNVGVYDANGNARIGDFGKFVTYKAAEGESWYFNDGDSFLVDANKSGTFENDPFDQESCPLASILYFGPAPYRAALAPDATSLRVEPWRDRLATVALGPKGEQVQSLSLAWEKERDHWQVIRAGVEDGRIQVAPGNYRLHTATLLGKGSVKDQVMVSGYQQLVKTPFTFSVDGPNSLKVGAPLEIKVAAERRTPEPWEDGRSAKGENDSDYVLGINATVVGSGGEVYSSFGKGEKFEGDPPKPAFTVADAGGKAIGDGNLEFG